ncbi:MAG: response regulator [Alphaproteobacteria bacterium]|nr:response regulator [Alphaproteobacteria bacterium]
MPKVLLIDDDTALTGMLTEFLRGEGFEIAAAFNGAEGVAAALDPDLDAVILDVMMPDISGIEALQRIRAASSVPVIMLTAKGDEEERVAGLEMGADDYIAKPYYPRELLARVRAVLRRQYSAAAHPPQHFMVGRPGNGAVAARSDLRHAAAGTDFRPQPRSAGRAVS